MISPADRAVVAAPCPTVVLGLSSTGERVLTNLTRRLRVRSESANYLGFRALLASDSPYQPRGLRSEIPYLTEMTESPLQAVISAYDALFRDDLHAVRAQGFSATGVRLIGIGGVQELDAFADLVDTFCDQLRQAHAREDSHSPSTAQKRANLGPIADSLTSASEQVSGLFILLHDAAPQAFEHWRRFCHTRHDRLIERELLPIRCMGVMRHHATAAITTEIGQEEEAAELLRLLLFESGIQQGKRYLPEPGEMNIAQVLVIEDIQERLKLFRDQKPAVRVLTEFISYEPESSANHDPTTDSDVTIPEYIGHWIDRNESPAPAPPLHRYFDARNLMDAKVEDICVRVQSKYLDSDGRSIESSRWADSTHGFARKELEKQLRGAGASAFRSLNLDADEQTQRWQDELQGTTLHARTHFAGLRQFKAELQHQKDQLDAARHALKEANSGAPDVPSESKSPLKPREPLPGLVDDLQSARLAALRDLEMRPPRLFGHWFQLALVCTAILLIPVLRAMGDQFGQLADPGLRSSIVFAEQAMYWFYKSVSTAFYDMPWAIASSLILTSLMGSLLARYLQRRAQDRLRAHLGPLGRLATIIAQAIQQSKILQREIHTLDAQVSRWIVALADARYRRLDEGSTQLHRTGQCLEWLRGQLSEPEDPDLMRQAERPSTAWRLYRQTESHARWYLLPPMGVEPPQNVERSRFSPWRTFERNALDDNDARDFFLWPDRFRAALSEHIDLDLQQAPIDVMGGDPPDWTVLHSGLTNNSGLLYETEHFLFVGKGLQTQQAQLVAKDIRSTLEQTLRKDRLQRVSETIQEPHRIYVLQRQSQNDLGGLP